MQSVAQPSADVRPNGTSSSPNMSGTSRREQALAAIRSNPDLPTPPAIALKVFEKVSEPDCSLQDVAAIVSRDPALSAKLLRAVNSALYGLNQPVASISGAVCMLGINAIRSLVLTLTLPSIQRSNLSPEVLRSYWRVSVAGAIAARELSQRMRRPCPDNDFVAGLVRDLGILIFHRLFPEEYQSILSIAPPLLSSSQCEIEEQALAINHAELGAELLHNWCLPAEITEPIRYHHNWEAIEKLRGDERERARLLFFASQIGQLQVEANQPLLVREIIQRAEQQFAMKERELRSFLENLQARMAEVASLLQVDIGECLTYAAVLNRGIEELTRLAVQATIASAASRTPVRTDINPAGGPASARPASADLPPTTWLSQVSPVVDRPRSGKESELQMRLFPGPRKPGTLGQLDNYEVHELIGVGGMGAVFRAVDLQLQRTVAIKAMLPNLAASSTCRWRFSQEGRAVAAISHENVVAVHAVGELNGIPYLVMEYIKGMSLADRLLQKAPLPLKEVIRIGTHTASGLSAAHAKGLVHRDIKPANLLIEEGTGRVKIVDFGLVLGPEEVAQSSGMVGTPQFMSPEQAEGRGAGPASDMFSLGSILYTCCTGELAFDSDTVPALLKEICSRHPPLLRQKDPSLPAWLEEIVFGLLSKNPALRYPNASELKRLLVSRWASLYTGSGERMTGAFKPIAAPARAAGS